MTEDDKALLTTSVQCHEHIDASLVLHPTELTASVPSDPSLAIHWDVHLCAVIPIADIRDGYGSMQLLQQPTDVFLAALAFLQTASYEGVGANKLQDAPSCLFNLLLCSGFLANDVTQLIILDAQPICVEAPVI